MTCPERPSSVHSLLLVLGLQRTLQPPLVLRGQLPRWESINGEYQYKE